MKTKRRASKGKVRARSTSPEGGTQMIHVGVDLHQRFCYMTALEARGKTIQSGAVNNERLALRRYFRQFRGQAVQVAVEACGFWPGVSRGGGAGSDAVGVGASATGEGDRFGQVEERS